MAEKPTVYIDGKRASDEQQRDAWRPSVTDNRLYLSPDSDPEAHSYLERYSAEAEPAEVHLRSPKD